jgi:hypothetical protein
MTIHRWDECWECPHCHHSIACGNGRHGGGNTTVTFTQPPRCTCGREMEQVLSIGIQPPRQEQ